MPKKIVPKTRNDYWSQRETAFQSHLDELDERLIKEYQKVYREVHTDMVLLYDEIQNNAANGIVIANDIYRYDNYYKLMNSLQANLTSLGFKEIKQLEKYLTDMYKYSYEITGIEVKDDTFHSVSNDFALKKLVSQDWVGDGLNLSQRIWKGKEQIAEAVKEGLIDCLKRGKSSTQMATMLEQRFNVGINNARRLANTELTHAQIEGTLDRYTDSGYTKYMFCATKDSKTCAEDRELDGKIFLISEAQAGVNCPPLHPNCRCYTKVVLDKEVQDVKRKK